MRSTAESIGIKLGVWEKSDVIQDPATLLKGDGDEKKGPVSISAASEPPPWAYSPVKVPSPNRPPKERVFIFLPGKNNPFHNAASPESDSPGPLLRKEGPSGKEGIWNSGPYLSYEIDNGRLWTA